MMVRYEIKKVFLRTGSQIAILLLLAILAITCYLAVKLDYVNESGETETGFAAVRELRSAKKEWAGILDEEKIRKVIEENARIIATPQARSQDPDENDIAYSWKQGFSDIRELINRAYADGFRDYDYYKVDSIAAEAAKDFYPNRIILLKSWLADEAKDHFSEAEKGYLIKQYEELSTPIIYDYSQGWQQIAEYSSAIIMITMMVLGYLVAGIFSCEFQWRSDAVFFTTFHGRNKAVAAKIKAGFCMITAVYWGMILMFTGIVLGYLGADGGACPVQIGFGGWKSFYNITLWQGYLLNVLGGYIGCLFLSYLTMWVSAKTKSAVLAVMIPFIIIFLPSLVGAIQSPVIENILGLLPDRLLQVSTAMGYFEFYQLGGKVVGAVPVLLILYSVFTAILLPLTYHVYKNTQLN